MLQTGEVADAIIAAIEASNQDVVLLPRGSYTRVLVPRLCTVSREGVEEHLGRRIQFRRELEKVMPSFKGSLLITDERAEWRDRADSEVYPAG